MRSAESVICFYFITKHHTFRHSIFSHLQTVLCFYIVSRCACVLCIEGWDKMGEFLMPHS